MQNAIDVQIKLEKETLKEVEINLPLIKELNNFRKEQIKINNIIITEIVSNCWDEIYPEVFSTAPIENTLKDFECFPTEKGFEKLKQFYVNYYKIIGETIVKIKYPNLYLFFLRNKELFNLLK